MQSLITVCPQGRLSNRLCRGLSAHVPFATLAFLYDYHRQPRLSCDTLDMLLQVVAGIIERAQSAARNALSDNRSAQAPATFDSRPDLFAQLQSSLRGLGLDAGPAQQGAGQAGAHSAAAAPAGLQSLPSDALQYVMSGILGRWFRQHSAAENKNMLHRLRQQEDNHGEEPGTLFCTWRS